MDFSKFAHKSIAGYGQFISDLTQVVDPRRIRVCSIFPPALSDEAWADGYVNAHVAQLEGMDDLAALKASVRSLETPTQATRTAAHALYNLYLREMCDQMGLTFVDDFTPMLGGDGLLDPKFVAGAKGADHHLEWGPTSVVLPDIIRERVRWDGANSAVSLLPTVEPIIPKV